MFETINPNVPMDKQDKAINPLLYSHVFDKSQDLLVLVVDAVLNKISIELIKSIFSVNFPHTNYRILYPFPYELTQKEMKEDKKETWVEKKPINMKEYIPEGSKIVCFGRSICTLTKTVDLDAAQFLDTKFTDPSLYIPDLKCQAFPVQTFSRILHIAAGRFFDNFYQKNFMGQLRRAVKHKVDMAPEPKLNTTYLETVEDLDHFLRTYTGNDQFPYVSVDIETTGLNHVDDEIDCVGIAFSKNSGFYVDWKIAEQRRDELSAFFHSKKIIGNNFNFDWLFFKHGGVDCGKLYFDNMQAGHCINDLRNKGLKAQAFYYTRRGGYDRDLELHLRRFKKMKYSELPMRIKANYVIHDACVAFEVYTKLLKYLEDDSKLYNYFFGIMMPAVNFFFDIHYRGVNIHWDNVREVGRIMSKDLKILRHRIYTKFNTNSDALNLDSKKQLGVFIEKVLKWPAVKRTKGGYYSVKAENVAIWEKLGLEGATELMKYSQLSSLYNTYIGDESAGKGMWQYRCKDGKVHPTIWVGMTNTHRNRSTNPNIQNIPKHSKIAHKIRSIFSVPSDDFLIGSQDASGFQLRIVAAHSGDKNMIRAFTESHGDIHSEVGLNIFAKDTKIRFVELDGIRYSEFDSILVEENGVKKNIFVYELPGIDEIANDARPITIQDFLKYKNTVPCFKSWRFKAKGVSFSLVFNTTARAFAENSLKGDWTPAECISFLREKKHIKVDSYIEGIEKKNHSVIDEIYVETAMIIQDEFFKLYPGVKRWINHNIEFAKKHGYIRSPFGARRLLPELTYFGEDVDYMWYKSLMNKACNSPVQNHEWYIMMQGMMLTTKEMLERGMQTRFFATVHDDAASYLHRDEVQEYLEISKKYFEWDYPENKGIPMLTELNVSDYTKGEYWGFGKEVG